MSRLRRLGAVVAVLCGLGWAVSPAVASAPGHSRSTHPRPVNVRPVDWWF